MAVRWAFNARADLERIWHFHADRDPDRADAVVAIIEDRADALAVRPLHRSHRRYSRHARISPPRSPISPHLHDRR
ncbi:type II toxin-antitoxin system RelE/ParE family toxin [Flavisphingomonas formosensis]|uniref:type II toxin-antitoxin system RelE/ParE family toxin n=1 Tax=Flavisphingomonas formosensis TaxID=861534 RepID=UPI0012F7C9CD